MMRTGPFRYHAARSIDDAARALADGGPSARLLAGGTDLIPNMKRRQDAPELLISLRRIPELREVTENGATVIGAGTSLADVARIARHTALARAVAQIASPLIRSTATLGGNLCVDTRCNYFNQSLEWRKAIGYCLRGPIDDGTCWVAPSGDRCWAVSSSDSAPALIALGARITLVSTGGAREIALEDLYADDGAHPLTIERGEILTTIRIPPRDVRSTYWKLRRRGSIDFPVLGVAAAVRLDAHGVVAEARVVLGAVASRPILVPEAAMLLGQPLTENAIEAFAECASAHAKPLDNTDFHMTWRKAVARQYLAGALREVSRHTEG